MYCLAKTILPMHVSGACHSHLHQVCCLLTAQDASFCKVCLKSYVA